MCRPVSDSDFANVESWLHPIFSCRADPRFTTGCIDRTATHDELALFKELYRFLGGYRLHLPEKGEWACSPSSGSIVIFEEQ